MAMGVLIGGLLVIAFFCLGVTLGRGDLGWVLWATLGGGWGRCESTLGGYFCITGVGLVAAEAGSLHCEKKYWSELRASIW